ncbi:MAG: M48 family metallopeptidase [Planctomycetaceae bacterium]
MDAIPCQQQRDVQSERGASHVMFQQKPAADSHEVAHFQTAKGKRLRVAFVLMLLTVVATSGLLPGCLSAPISDRKQFVITSEADEIRMGEEAYAEILATETRSTNTEYQQLVEKVGRRIAAVSGRPDFRWEFQVLQSEEMNAFCLPGGKVAIYEGIIPLCVNEAGLAVVMSHEIAHALARHGGERMSQQAVAQTTGGLLNGITKDKSQQTQERVSQAYGAIAEYGVLLPYSRTHETEADSIGLTLMARAGYDPSEAPKFWTRFSEVSGPKQPEFMSTHPSDHRRSEHLSELLPQAMLIYEAAKEKLGTGVTISPAPLSSSTRSSAPPSTTNSGATGSSILPIGFAEPDRTHELSSEFVPPITRDLRGTATSSGPSEESSSSSSPRPFPSTTALPDKTWKSAAP